MKVFTMKTSGLVFYVLLFGLALYDLGAAVIFGNVSSSISQWIMNRIEYSPIFAFFLGATVDHLLGGYMRKK